MHNLKAGCSGAALAPVNPGLGRRAISPAVDLKGSSSKRAQATRTLRTRRRFLVSSVQAAITCMTLLELPCCKANAGPCPPRQYNSGLYGRDGCYAGYGVRLLTFAQTADQIRASGFRLTVAGDGSKVIVEFSDDLSAWAPLANHAVVAPAEGTEVVDPAAASAGHRFYRVRILE
jgi:hypothetical protein